MKREVEISIISDIHLGTDGCHATELLHYLRNLRTKTLIINGDFIDVCNFRKKGFPKTHMQVIQRILEMSIKGTKVYYITGNHDDNLRGFTNFNAGNIQLRDKLVLQLNAKRYWIFHGDVFDRSIRLFPTLAKIGGRGYDWLIWYNRLVDKVRIGLGFGRMSISNRVKNRVKKAIRFVSDFEDTVIKLARQQNYDYVVCGHLHKPQLRVDKRDGKSVTYMNSGDWVENLSALEYRFGQWKIYRYEDDDFTKLSKKIRVKDTEELVWNDPSIQQELLLRKILGDSAPQKIKSPVAEKSF